MKPRAMKKDTNMPDCILFIIPDDLRGPRIRELLFPEIKSESRKTIAESIRKFKILTHLNVLKEVF